VTQVINVTFRFLRDQFVPLAKGLLLLAGPFIILGNVAAAYVSASASMTTADAVLLLIQFAGTAVGSIIALAIVVTAPRVCHREGPEALTTSRMWKMARTYGLGLFGRQIQYGLILAVVSGGLVFLGAMVGITAGEGPVAIGIAGLVGVAILAWLIYAGPTFALLFPGQVDTERSISLYRCVQLVRGQWGQTFGVWLLASVISFILFSVGWVSQAIVGIVQGAGISVSGTVLPLVGGLVGGVASTLAPAVIYTAYTFQYYNLVEQKEQVSLEEEVAAMENTSDAAKNTSDATGGATPGAGAPSPEPSGGTAATGADDGRSRPADEEATGDGDAPTEETTSDTSERWRGRSPSDAND
jgi:hypothetical protein